MSPSKHLDADIRSIPVIVITIWMSLLISMIIVCAPILLRTGSLWGGNTSYCSQQGKSGKARSIRGRCIYSRAKTEAGSGAVRGSAPERGVVTKSVPHVSL